jgi:hypothetical protein
MPGSGRIGHPGRNDARSSVDRYAPGNTLELLEAYVPLIAGGPSSIQDDDAQ